MSGPLSRRGFFSIAGGALAGLSASGCGDDATNHPPTIGATEVTLDIAFQELTIAGYRVKLRCYGGSLPGPTIVVHPGERLLVRVRNFLPEYDSALWHEDMSVLGPVVAMNVPHHLNTTNLHVHGMSVIPHLFEPLGTSNPMAPMIEIGPGEQRLYDFAIPENHPSGLYWYHPHSHGATAVQVVNGMAGMIVIKGPIDEVPEIAAADEILLAVHDLGLFPDDAANPTLWSYDPPQNAMWDTFSATSTVKNPDGSAGEVVSSGFSVSDYPLRLFLLNGQPFFEETHNAANVQFPLGKPLAPPRYLLRPGQVVRFRLLNACSDNLMPVVVDDHTMYLLAMDGVNFLETAAIAYVEGAKVLGQEQVLLAPAGRAEFLIRANAAPGVYAIRALAHGTDVQFFASAAKVIAEIEIEGDPVEMALPTTLPTPTRYYPLTTGTEPAVRREVMFNMNFATPENKVVGGDFTVNDQLYDELGVTFEPKLGTVEEWTLSVMHDPMVEPEGHPFHLHDNSFEVVSIGGKQVVPIVLQDTVWIPPDEKVVIRIRFQEFTGKTVFHCHILPHEDAGMMQNILMHA